MSELLKTRRLLSMAEVAELTGYPIRTLRDQRLRGEGLGSLSYKPDGESKVVFDPPDIERYLSEAKEQERRQREADRLGGQR